MRAAMLHGWKEPFVLEELPRPVPGPGQVLIRVAGAGVCHSDLHVRDGQMAAMPFEFPLLLGHENAGWVKELGPGVSGLDVGRPVLVFGGWGCGSCRVCLAGEEQLCDVMRWGGLGPPGGYAEFLLVPAVRHLVPLTSLDPLAAAPLSDAALTPYRAVKQALPRLVPGTTAVVIGAGGLGQFAVQLLDVLSPATVVALDIAADKRVAAGSLGAEFVFDPREDAVPDALQSIAGVEGVAAVFDFVGTDESLSLAARTVGRKGLLTVVGLGGGSLPYSFLGLRTEATVTSSTWGSRTELAEVVALAEAGLIATDVERRPLEDINQAFADLAAGAVRGRLVLVP